MAVSNPNRNPRTGNPSVLCECGHWNDRQVIPGNEYKKFSEKYEKVFQCRKCARQLRKRYHPPEKIDTKDQIQLGNQMKLSHFMRCKK